MRIKVTSYAMLDTIATGRMDFIALYVDQPVSSEAWGGSLTLIFLFLHRWQPALDFL